MFLIISISIFADGKIAVSANGEAMVHLDRRIYKITAFYSNIASNSEKIFENLEFGAIINNKFISVKEMNNTLEYVNGTGIIKIFSKYENIGFSFNIFCPIETQDNTFYIVSFVNTNNMKGKVDIKFYYYISKNKECEIIYESVDNSYKINNDLIIKSLKNKSNLYITDDESIKDFKLKRVQEKLEKKLNENILFITDAGKLGAFEEREDAIIFTLEENKKKLFFDNVKQIIDNEINSWNYFTKNINLDFFSEAEKGIVLQNIIYIKMAQSKKGFVLSNLNADYREIVARDIIFAGMAYVKTGNFFEAKAIIDYILNSNSKNIVASYGYDYFTNSEKLKKVVNEDFISYSNIALFLIFLSEYINKTGDYSFIKNNYRKFTEDITNFLISKVKNGIVESSYSVIDENSKKDNNILNQYVFYLAVKNFSEQIKFIAPKGLIEKYTSIVNLIKGKTEELFISPEGIIWSSLNDKSYNPYNAICFRDDFITNKVVIEKSLNYYLTKYKIHGFEGYSDKENDSDDNVLLEFIILDTLYKNGYYEKANEIKKRLENIFKENLCMIPYRIKNMNDLRSYSNNGILTFLSALYIIMVYDKYK